MEKQLISQFSLPTYIKGKTFADASKAIERKFKDRSDKTATDTKQELLARLAKAQEYLKMQEGLKNESQQIPDQMNGQVPDGMQEFAKGGFMDFMGNNGEGIMAAGQGIGVAGQIAAGENSVIAGDPATNAAVDATKDTIAKATGPFGQAFRGIQKAGQGIGNTIGGEGGAAVSGIFSPEESTIANFKDKDLNVGEKLLGTVPGLGAVIAKRSAAKKAGVIQHDNTIGQSIAIGGSDFAYGGKMSQKQYGGGGKLDEQFKVTNPLFNNLGPDLKPQMAPAWETAPKPQARPELSGFNKGMDWLGENSSNIAQYAPVANNLLELKNLKRAATQRGNRLDNVYKPQQFDEAQLVNQVNQQNIERSLTESSGGDLGALRTNLIGAGTAKLKAQSAGMAAARDVNRDEGRFAFQTGLQRDTFNAAADERFLDRSARDKAAYETTKSNLKRALSEDIGAIGREEVDKKIVKEMFGYKWNGKYYIDKDGKKHTSAEVNAKIKEKKLKEKDNGGSE
jgi:hypothetical protein